MAAAATVKVSTESVGVCVSHSGNNRTVRASEREAKLRERHAAKVAAASITFPSDAICHAVIHACFELRRAGYVEGEIDDKVGAKYGIPGWLVQHIVIYFAEMKVRELEAAQSLTKNVIDAIRQMGRETFEDAPGHSW